LFVAAGITAVGAIGSPRATGQEGPGATANKIEPWVIAHTANGQQAELMVVLVDQVDLRPAAALATKNEKSRYVHDALWNKSQAAQGPILQWLRERGLEYRSFYIVNGILVKGSREVAEALAARPDVARVEGNPQIRNVLPQPITTVEAPSQPETPNAVQSNINYTHAPQVWARGFTGRGLVIGTADTGVRWTHNALKSHYRGWSGTTANHNYNWHDSVHNSAANPCGNNANAPCDDQGHGTHTIGTAIGDDGMGNQIGMAPSAKWIGCRNMDQGSGTPARYIECMEFFLAPYPVGGTPAQGDPTLAPDITTNSWTCPPAEGCSVNTLRAAVEAQQAAGIMMVAAAGNQGPGCSTLLSPPSFYQASYTVGALTTGTDTIAPFSNRGSVTVDGSHRLKPDITAPGTDIRSSLNTSDTAYGTMTGTSMATPHIAGAVALLWSARPEFRHHIDVSRTAINDAAVHILSGACDGGHSVTPNNTYGHGRVNILAAVTQPAPILESYDFNNDAYSDLLLFNAGTRQTAVWYMNNNVRIGHANGPSLPGGWSLASVADFNRDDHPDYLLLNAATRGTVIWYMNNNVRIGNAFGPTLPVGWTVVALGDFNSDEYPDYLLFNANTGGTLVWYMRNNVRIGSASGPTVPAGRSVAGVADFNGDTHPDLLLFNAATRGTVIWYLSGVTRTGSRNGPTIPAADEVAGLADFDGNGRPDYLLYNSNTRQTAIWYLNNNLLIGHAAGPTIPAGSSVVAP
jgi:subtilisin family serine protease